MGFHPNSSQRAPYWEHASLYVATSDRLVAPTLNHDVAMVSNALIKRWNARGTTMSLLLYLAVRKSATFTASTRRAHYWRSFKKIATNVTSRVPSWYGGMPLSLKLQWCLQLLSSQQICINILHKGRTHNVGTYTLFGPL